MATRNTVYKIMQLTEQEYTTLSTTGTLTKDGTTYTYSPNDTIYVTPDEYITLAELQTVLADYLTTSSASSTYQTKTGRVALPLSSYDGTNHNCKDISTLTSGTYDITEGGYICANPLGSNPEYRESEVMEGSILIVDSNGYCVFFDTDGIINLVDVAGTEVIDWNKADVQTEYDIDNKLSAYETSNHASQTYQPLPSQVTLSDSTATSNTDTFTYSDSSVFTLFETNIASITSVSVNSTVTSNYTVSGNKVTITDTLPPNASIEIVYNYYPALELANNTEYYSPSGGLSTLVFTYPQNNFECYMTLTFASSETITVIFPESSYIGDAPTFANDETWEISIKNKVIVAGKVE